MECGVAEKAEDTEQHLPPGACSSSCERGVHPWEALRLQQEEMATLLSLLLCTRCTLEADHVLIIRLTDYIRL